MEPMSTAMLPATKEMMTGEIDASIIATPVGNASSIPTGFTNLGLDLSEKSGNLDANPSPINVSSTATAGANIRAERISLSPSPAPAGELREKEGCRHDARYREERDHLPPPCQPLEVLPDQGRLDSGEAETLKGAARRRVLTVRHRHRHGRGRPEPRPDPDGGPCHESREAYREPREGEQPQRLTVESLPYDRRRPEERNEERRR